MEMFNLVLFKRESNKKEEIINTKGAPSQLIYSSNIHVRYVQMCGYMPLLKVLRG